MGHIAPEDVLMRMWPTPNPNALKFTLNVPLKLDGKATFNSSEECENFPLVYSLFLISGIKRVYLFQNQMTLTHDSSLSNDEIKEQVSSIIQTRILTHNPDFEHSTAQAPVKRASSDDPLIQQIEDILDRTIRPGLQADGGDIEIISADEKEVRISYQGACGGCPSAMGGTLDAIENILRHELGNSNLSVIPL